MILPAEMELLAWVISGFMGAMWMAASVHKLHDPMAFYAHIDAYRLLPTTGSWWLSKVLPWMEMLIALLLLIPASSQIAACSAFMLLLLYALAMAINLLRGRRDLDCGCGGDADRISWWLVCRNGLLAVAVSALALAPLPSVAWLHAVISVGCGILIWLVYALYEKVRFVLGRNKLISSAVTK